MPRSPGIDHQEAVRAPQKTGFRVVGQGKHIVMSDGVRLVTIPRHNPVEPALPRVRQGRFVTVDWAPSNVGMQPPASGPRRFGAVGAERRIEMVIARAACWRRC